ncbi:unnamed protein product [Cladocopium goreaui]|uniref:Uncharacterized protein n=1 Tax=Cladocopium goreaui TaxID=2562237 RepID=A0A9P1GNH2_9DINO|nr:unnamed protein product [Cladocopium goreaui]
MAKSHWLRSWPVALLWIPVKAELGFLNMENMCVQTPLPFICPSNSGSSASSGSPFGAFPPPNPSTPSCSTNPDSCCKQSSCIQIGGMALPMIGACRPDRGETRCADMSTPFGGMGVCQCAQGVCASNGVCMDNSFLGLGGLLGTNKNFDANQNQQYQQSQQYQPYQQYQPQQGQQRSPLPFFGRLYKASDHVVPPEDHLPGLLILGFCCFALVLFAARRCATQAAPVYQAVSLSEASEEDA